jgi:hypothetical protein
VLKWRLSLIFIRARIICLKRGYLTGYEPELGSNLVLCRVAINQPFQIVKILGEATHIAAEAVKRRNEANVRKSHEYFRTIRQPLNLIVCLIPPCQSATPIKKPWSKLKRLLNPHLSKGLIFWSRPISSVSYAKPKIGSTPKPIRQEPVEKARKVRFSFSRTLDVFLGERHRVRRFSLRLSASPFAFSASLFHLKKYVVFLLTSFESIHILSNSQSDIMANKRLSKEKQALVLAALCEGTPIRACARMFKTSKNTIKRVISETGEAFADYMERNFRDLPCTRIEMDEQWQYVGAHGSRLIKPEPERRRLLAVVLH